MSTARLWCSLHIYYHGDQGPLLVGCVEPLSRALRSGGLASRMFYLRYWRGGPHVRVRFRAPSADARETALTVACARVDEYLRRSPSQTVLDHERYLKLARQFSSFENEGPGHEELLPNNSWRLERYEPEFTKYGGPSGTAMAEDVFDESTQIALRLLPVLATSREKALGRAFLMLLAGSLGFGLPLAEASAFLAWYQRIWARYVPLSAQKNWEARLAENRGPLDRAARALFEGTGALPDGVSAWQDAMRRAAAALRAAGNAVLDAVQVDLPAAHKRSFLLMNYLHTHNNRLGVVAADEAYLGFLGSRVVDDVVTGQRSRLPAVWPALRVVR